MRFSVPDKWSALFAAACLCAIQPCLCREKHVEYYEHVLKVVNDHWSRERPSSFQTSDKIIAEGVQRDVTRYFDAQAEESGQQPTDIRVGVSVWECATSSWKKTPYDLAETIGPDRLANLVLPWTKPFNLTSRDLNEEDCTLQTEGSRYTAECYEEGSALFFSKPQLSRQDPGKTVYLTKMNVMVAHWLASTEPLDPVRSMASDPWAAVSLMCTEHKRTAAQKFRVEVSASCFITQCRLENEPRPRVIFAAPEEVISNSIGLEKFLAFKRKISGPTATRNLEILILPAPDSDSRLRPRSFSGKRKRGGYKEGPLKKHEWMAPYRQPEAENARVGEVIKLATTALKVTLQKAVDIGDVEKKICSELAGHLQAAIGNALNKNRPPLEQFGVGVSVWAPKKDVPWSGPFYLASSDRDGNNCLVQDSGISYSHNCFAEGSALVFSSSLVSEKRRKMVHLAVMVVHWPADCGPRAVAPHETDAIRHCIARVSKWKPGRPVKLPLMHVASCVCSKLRAAQQAAGPLRMLFMAPLEATSGSVGLEGFLPAFTQQIESANRPPKDLSVLVLPMCESSAQHTSSPSEGAGTSSAGGRYPLRESISQLFDSEEALSNFAAFTNRELAKRVWDELCSGTTEMGQLRTQYGARFAVLLWDTLSTGQFPPGTKGDGSPVYKYFHRPDCHSEDDLSHKCLLSGGAIELGVEVAGRPKTVLTAYWQRSEEDVLGQDGAASMLYKDAIQKAISDVAALMKIPPGSSTPILLSSEVNVQELGEQIQSLASQMHRGALALPRVMVLVPAAGAFTQSPGVASDKGHIVYVAGAYIYTSVHARLAINKPVTLSLFMLPAFFPDPADFTDEAADELLDILGHWP